MGFSGACIDLLHAHSQSLLAAGRHTSAPQLSLVHTERPPVQKQISRSLRSQLQVILMDRGSVISLRALNHCIWHSWLDRLDGTWKLLKEALYHILFVYFVVFQFKIS